MPAGVQEVLAARCGSCHGPEKQKGGVRVVPIGGLFEGDQRDWVVVPGQPDQSELLTRIMLPAGHEDIMPPEDPPLTAEQIEMIRSWIAVGTSKQDLMAAAVSQGGAVDIRTWAAVYFTLDLTPQQRQAGLEAARQLRSLRKGRRKGQAGEEAPEKGRAAMDAMRAELAAVQTSLWDGLNKTQQAAMKAALEDPAKVKEAKRQLRGIQGGRSGGRGGPKTP